MDGKSFMQVDIERTLSPLELQNLQDPNSYRGRSSWRPLTSDQDQSPWESIPASGVRPELFEEGRTPFISRQYAEAMAAIQSFQEERQCDMRLNGETGLPDFLFGDLYPERSDTDNLAAAARFLQANQLVIAGRDRSVPRDEDLEPDGAKVGLGVVGRIRWKDGTDQIRFQQFGPEGVPVYGAQVVTTFDATGKLAIVSSSLYPAAEELPRLLQSSNPETWFEALGSQLPERIGVRQPIVEGPFSRPSFWVYPQRIYQNLATSPKDYITLMGKCATYNEKMGFWHFDLDAWLEGAGPDIRGRFVPVVKVWFEDQYRSQWHAMLDITEPNEPVLIYFSPDEQCAPYLVFPNAVTARNYFSELAQPGANAQELVTVMHLEHELDFGNGSGFGNADGVQCIGQINDPAALRVPALDNPDTFRVSTTFYHLRQAQFKFSQFMNQAQIAAPISSGNNPLNNIIVELNDLPQASCYMPSDKTIHISRRFVGETRADDIFVEESGLDPEVVVHEFAHAVMDFFFANLRLIGDQRIKLVFDGFDEGQAFYLSTVVFENAQWSDYAYAAWSEARDLSKPAGLLPWPVADPFDTPHGLGIWLARLFWQINTQTTSGRSMNYLLFKAMGSLARNGLSNNTPNEGFEVQLKGMFNLIANAIYAQSDSTSQRTLIQSIFTDAGLTIP